MNAALQSPAKARAIVRRTRGQTHGPIARLVSPSDLGELIKPFVFLDLFKIPATGAPLFGWHPHSGIATLTLVHEGATTYEETTGQKGVLSAGSVEWMRAGRGVWHTGTTVGPETTKGFQLWIALPEQLELAPSQSRYLSAEEVPVAGSARRDSCRNIKCHRGAARHQLSRCAAEGRRALALSAARGASGRVARRVARSRAGRRARERRRARGLRGIQRRSCHSCRERGALGLGLRHQTPAPAGTRSSLRAYDRGGTARRQARDCTHR